MDVKYQKVIETLNKSKAKEWQKAISEYRSSNYPYGNNYEKFAEIIGYPKTNVWTYDGVVSPFLSKLLVLIKILSITGTLPKCRWGTFLLTPVMIDGIKSMEITHQY